MTPQEAGGVLKVGDVAYVDSSYLEYFCVVISLHEHGIYFRDLDEECVAWECLWRVPVELERAVVTFAGPSKIG